MLRLRFERRAGHPQRVQRPRASDVDRGSESMRLSVLVPYLVLVVVVPSEDAQRKQLALQRALPPFDAGRVGEIDVRPLPVPELADAGFAVAGVIDERAS